MFRVRRPYPNARRVMALAASWGLLVGGLALAGAPAASAAELPPIAIDCGYGAGTPVIAVTGVVGDTITISRSQAGDCSHTSSTPGVVSWTSDALNAIGQQNPSYTWASKEGWWDNEAIITITLLKEGTTTWTASQRTDGLILNITVRAASTSEPLEIESLDQLDGGTEGEPYASSLGALGGTTPYTWSVASGALPPGLSLSPEGEVKGTPTKAGSYAFTARVTDAAGAQAEVELEIAIEPAAVSEANVPICHATADGYELVTTTEAVFDGEGEHGDHSGDIVPDIIRAGAGRNWDAAGIVTFFAGCGPAAAAIENIDGDGLPPQFDPDDDGDGIADVADTDDDGDGIPDTSDLESYIAPDQDSDGLPDALDPDDDGDCLADSDDADRDGDGIADAVDPDIDNDGIPDTNDIDRDGDGVPNLLDLDVDGDGVANSDESGARSAGMKTTCPADTDLDGDGIPNAKDTDDDGDGIPDRLDRVQSRPWVDTDNDGTPNYRDSDVDNDGTPNAADADADGDGVVDTRDRDANADGIVETRPQPLAKPFRLPAITPGVATVLTSGALTTVAGQRATVDVTCSAGSSRSKVAGDIGAPDPSGRCLVVKDGDRLRLFVYEGKPTTVKVTVSAPAVDNYRVLSRTFTAQVG